MHGKKKMRPPLSRIGIAHDMPLFIAAVFLLAVAFSLPGRWLRGPGKLLSFVAAILLAIGFPLLGGPLLIYLIFKPRD
jgi:hypothetical protein